MLIKGIPRRLTTGSRVLISSDSPELEIASNTSPRTSIPKSPCPASPGCIKKAGVPVEAKVAAILRPINPDLPIPVTTRRPLQAKITSQACAKRSSICSVNKVSAAISVLIASIAVAINC